MFALQAHSLKLLLSFITKITIMKRVLIILIILPLVSFSQIQVDENNNIFFEQVYEINLSKEEIKSNVNEWMATNFNDANNVIKMNTSDKIIAKGLFLIPNVYKGYTSNLEIHYDLITDFKEDRYKVLIQNLEITNIYGGDMPISKDFMSMDEYKLYSLKVANKMSTTKAMKKIMESDKYLELYNQSKEMYSKNLQDIEIRLVGIAGDINKTVHSNLEKSDW